MLSSPWRVGGVLGAVALVLGAILFSLPPGKPGTTAPTPAGGGPRPTPTAEAPTGPPRLAVFLVFDQFRGDYLGRWGGLFGEGGFRRLMNDGAWFTECRYPYATTVTGAGHASLATGALPQRHGIIANTWYDRAAVQSVYCASEARYGRVPAVAGEGDKKGSGSPGRLLAPTLADAVKAATKGKAKVVSLSMKDRGAVFGGGRKPDACYWFDTGDGQFVTSTYYRDSVHPWVAAFNRSGRVNEWKKQGKWERLRPEIDYARYSGPDDGPGEWGLMDPEWKKAGSVMGVTFPHPLGGDMYFDALYNSPFGNDLLLELVRAAVKEEKLGTGEEFDLLLVSFSCNDPVGHAWGPDSWEVMDTTLRTDRLMEELLTYLDRQVGKGRYYVVLSADHGICPLPDRAAAQGWDAGRLDGKDLTRDAEAFLQAAFPGAAVGQALEAPVTNDSFYLRRDWLKGRGLEGQQARVEQVLAAWLTSRPGIAAAYTRTQLLQASGGVAATDEIGKRVRNSFHPERSGDVVFVTKPFWFTAPPGRDKGTTHGTPHPYDTYVPLLVYGPTVKAGVRTEPITPQAGVPILAHAMGIAPPEAAEVAVPKGLFVEK